MKKCIARMLGKAKTFFTEGSSQGKQIFFRGLLLAAGKMKSAAIRAPAILKSFQKAAIELAQAVDGIRVRERAKENQKLSEGRGAKRSVQMDKPFEPVDTRTENAKAAGVSNSFLPALMFHVKHYKHKKCLTQFLIDFL